MPPDAVVRPSSDRVCRRPAALRRIVCQAADDEPSTVVDLWSYKPNRIRELTLKFSGSAADLIGDSSPFLGITRLICVSFGITRLVCASFGITRLIGVSFGVTRLIRASFGIARLMCKGIARGRPTRGKKDA
ncbi:hypothetical protein E5676_scaffold313G001370 [Cucumis melo var. makuwa]|uniref:Uncharacterized protein n=1 Tax=Cucumis melo var. makuwa TaxID=1194695 RepID=A0A5D3DS30_CUCMM|nr:hypothetical protein E6C27_scaffold40G00610 [Cucumis melo var. makuwa]TYK26541.1 hypothetical protein E5676_scaffold313G001370 [Cucumis melo var. makuwa]